MTVLSPITKDMPFLGLAAIKGQVVALPRFYLALQGRRASATPSAARAREAAAGAWAPAPSPPPACARTARRS
jgi:hypothetical protein